VEAAGSGPVDAGTIDAPTRKPKQAPAASVLSTVPTWGYVLGGLVAAWALYRIAR
jgi:hypothetical protein